MPSAAVLGPVVIPVVAAAGIAAFGLARIALGRMAAAAGAWGSVVALFAVWLPVRSSLELTLGQLGFGSALDRRTDGVTFAFGLRVALPAAVVLSLQPRAWPEAALSMLALTAAMASLEAGGVVLTAIAGGTAATLAIIMLDTEEPRATRPSWALLLSGWLGLTWVGVILQIGGGTAVYTAVPVGAVTGPVFVVLAVSAVIATSLFPWRTWLSRLWARTSLRAAAITIATLYPLGFYLLVRAYELGDGRYPHPLFNVVLASISIAAAFGAAARAQAAITRREFFGEVIPGFGGFALIAIALGTPLGLVAGLIMLATASAMVACMALLPDRAGLAPLVTIPAAVGLPPGLAFGARVIGLQADFEAGDFLGLIGVAGAPAWVTWVGAGARAICLPGGRGRPTPGALSAGGLGVAELTHGARAALAGTLVRHPEHVAAQ